MPSRSSGLWPQLLEIALRRALLSSIEGAAITAVRIEGVLHEFSSIPGVVEDATDIILTQAIPFKLHTNEPKTLRLSRSEPGFLKSGDIEADPMLKSLTRMCIWRPSAKAAISTSNCVLKRTWVCFGRAKLR